ncbi:methylmalonyl Co-A mutase-associated GTPase MeaB, partial [Nocardiopsis tropica]|nr:methylmalonyl Co-A mutase-associated GTPase MeaB [Nocardiopsis tropica]
MGDEGSVPGARGGGRRPVDVAALAEGVLSGHRPTLARAITLVESRR